MKNELPSRYPPVMYVGSEDFVPGIFALGYTITPIERGDTRPVNPDNLEIIGYGDQSSGAAWGGIGYIRQLMASGRQVILIHRVGEEPVFPQFEGSDDEDEY